MLKIYQLRKRQNTFEITLQYKGVGVRVSFVDGNTYNDIPAKCYTNDKFKQMAIENSQMYKNKEIVLERQVEEESDRKAAANKPVLQQKRVQKPAPAKPAPAKPAKPAPKLTPNPKQTPNPEQTPEPPVDPEPAKDGDGLEKKTFDNLAEAIQFIATNYQVQVTTPNEARNFLKEHGIKATIKQG